MTIRIFGLRCGARSWILTLLTLAVGALWLAYPLLWPMLAPGREALEAEAPLALGLLVVLLALCWVALWLDSGQEVTGIGFAVILVLVNVVARSWLNPGGGVEVNYILPLLAGAAVGGPFGFVVGASSALVSQFAEGLVQTPLPGQLVVWGLAGLLGGLVHRFRTPWAWALSVPIGVAFGLIGGVLLNLIGWPTSTDNETSAYFFPGLPGWINASRLISYTWQTSLGYDLARGITTALGTLVVGLPVISGLRRLCAPDITPDAVTPPPRPGPTPRAITRRDRARRLVDRWNHPPTQETP